MTDGRAASDQQATESERQSVAEAVAALSQAAGPSGRSQPGDTRHGDVVSERGDAWEARDSHGADRDRAAEARDREAARRDEAAIEAEALLRAAHSGDPEIIAALDRLVGAREAATADRRRSSEDRERATRDRRAARATVRRAHIDGLTGVYTREQGYAELQHEIDRCRRTDAPFVLAFIDIDGLKQLNDTLGHAAGDALIRKVCGVLKQKLRTYDPIVRIGGDEFLCGLSGTAPPAAAERVAKIREAVQHGHPPGTISVGYADLNPDDNLETLIDRADHDMYRHRTSR